MSQTRPMHRLRMAPLWLGALASITIAACAGTDFNIAGYTTRSQFARSVRTIHVPIFRNKTFVRGIEIDLTKTIIQQIELRTPWKVVNTCNADAELRGTVVAVNKRIVTQNPLNEVREAEIALGVEVVFRDLHTGQVFSCAGPLPDDGPGIVDPLAPPPPPPAPVIVQRSAAFIPELGESLASVKKEVVDDLARQIVSMMETPW